MKIRMITFHTPLNYGAVLQAYALQSHLKKYSDDVKIIDYRTPELLNRYRYFSKGKKIKSLFINLLKLKDYKKFINKNKKFQEFSKRYLDLTNQVQSKEEISDLLKDTDYIFTGSDQVFNPNRIKEERDVFYLDFDTIEAKRVAYAPSFGVQDVPFSQKQEIIHKLEKFYRLSAREEQGVGIIKELINKDVKQTLDPVFLLDSNEWEKIMEPRAIKKKYVLCYSLFNTALEEKIVNYIRKKMDLDVVLITNKNFPKIHNAHIIRDASPTEFLYLISKAEYIITDSFHGIVFSTIFKKRFNLIIGDNNTSSRMKSFLKKINLENRICIDENNIDYSDINYNEIYKIINQEKEFSKEYVEKALKNEEESEFNNSSEKQNIEHIKKLCTGCGTCSIICPQKAIMMKKNSEGFFYPQIDKDKCINCKLCIKKCHLTNKKKPEKHKAYFGRSKNNEVIKESSSGGIFYHLSRKFLEDKGIVYGAVLNKDTWSVEHKSTQEVDLQEMMKSKYVQSSTHRAFLKISQDIKLNKKVLFAGTPCQVAAVNKLLNCDKNLYTIDFICHGVPSPKILEEKITSMEKKYKSKVININFRNKYNNWSEQKMYMEFANGKKYFMSAKVDDYFNLFLKNYILRKACYHCKYSNEQHYSDITLADFWAINNLHPELNDEKGYSLIIVNTNKGQEFIDKIKKDIDINELEWEKAIYVYKTHKNYPEESRDIFFENMKKESYDNCVKKIQKKEKIKTKLKNIFIKYKYKYISKKM